MAYEVLEGVLSEEILDTLASDLGLEADVLRQHPFFRVLKGRVLLTYPLRVQELQFTPYVYAGNLAAGASYQPAAGTIIMNAYLVAATKLECKRTGFAINYVAVGDYTGNGWVGATYCDGGANGTSYKNTDVGAQDLYLLGVSMS